MQSDRPESSSMSEPSGEPQAPWEKAVDRVLQKYVVVWLWSILFGSSSTIIYSFVTFVSREKWGMLGLLLVALMASAGLCALGALVALMQYLTRYLIPSFFSDVGREASPRQAAFLLKRAIGFLVLAIAMRFLSGLVELLYGTMSSWGAFPR